MASNKCNKVAYFQRRAQQAETCQAEECYMFTHIGLLKKKKKKRGACKSMQIPHPEIQQEPLLYNCPSK